MMKIHAFYQNNSGTGHAQRWRLTSPPPPRFLRVTFLNFAIVLLFNLLHLPPNPDPQWEQYFIPMTCLAVFLSNQGF